ncbi:MAG: hypothetical protein RMK29_15995 [Myxococcales bacterium]|nr:hypothetical protein [Myxococcales bacterium]
MSDVERDSLSDVERDSLSDVEKDSLSEALISALAGLAERLLEERRAYYAAHSGGGLGSADAIVSHGANWNALTAGGASLVPGPWGLLTIVSELVLVVRNQLRMIYDLAVLHRREHVMGRDLLLGILTTAMGGGALG